MDVCAFLGVVQMDFVNVCRHNIVNYVRSNTENTDFYDDVNKEPSLGEHPIIME